MQAHPWKAAQRADGRCVHDADIRAVVRELLRRTVESFDEIGIASRVAQWLFMGSKEMRTRHVETHQHDVTRAEEQGEVEPLEARVATVVDGILREAETALVLAEHQPKPMELRAARLVVRPARPRLARGRPLLASEAGGASPLLPPDLVTGIEDFSGRKPLVSVVHGQNGQPACHDSLGGFGRQGRS